MAATPKRDKLGHLADMEVEVSVELGRTTMSLSDLKRAKEGSVIQITRLAGQPFDVLINGSPFGHGEIVVSNEQMSCRLTHIEEPVEARKEVSL